MANYNEIDEARRVLKLGESATLREIKRAYRKLARRHHPDINGNAIGENDEAMKKLNWAYNLMTDYCAEYRYSFQEEAVARTYTDEAAWKNWRDNWQM
jgi:DnaJ-class molecular chaperone